MENEEFKLQLLGMPVLTRASRLFRRRLAGDRVTLAYTFGTPIMRQLHNNYSNNTFWVLRMI